MSSEQTKIVSGRELSENVSDADIRKLLSFLRIHTNMETDKVKGAVQALLEGKPEGDIADETFWKEKVDVDLPDVLKRAKEGRMFVHLQNGAPDAMAGYEVMPGAMQDGRKVYEIVNVTALPDTKGLGRTLTRAVMEKVARRFPGCPCMIKTMAPGMKEIAKKMGFRLMSLDELLYVRGIKTADRETKKKEWEKLEADAPWNVFIFDPLEQDSSQQI